MLDLDLALLSERVYSILVPSWHVYLAMASAVDVRSGEISGCIGASRLLNIASIFLPLTEFRPFSSYN